jgi:hypothetical protein
MPPGRCLPLLCLLLLLGSCSTDSGLKLSAPGTDAPPLVSDPRATADDLYFEVVRLHSLGLLSQGDFQALQRALNDVAAESCTDEELEERERSTLASFLRRRWHELRSGEHAALLEAESSGRGYLRQLQRAGLDEAERYSEYTLLVAGMLGVPTSREEMALMVGLPVGGFLLLRAKGVAARALPRLLRKYSSADEVVAYARQKGWSHAYASSPEELRNLAGEQAVRAAETGVPHIGTGGLRRPKPGKENPWNPSDRKDNCTACVTSVIRNSLDGYFSHDADEIERVFGHTGWERHLDAEKSLRYITDATGLRASRAKVQQLGPYAPVGHYTIYTRWDGVTYRHVVYGRVSPTGKVSIFDPQNMRRMTYEEFLGKYGKKIDIHLLEAAP